MVFDPQLAVILLTPAALLLFLVGALLTKGVKRHAWHAGVIGALLSATALTCWFDSQLWQTLDRGGFAGMIYSLWTENWEYNQGGCLIQCINLLELPMIGIALIGIPKAWGNWLRLMRRKEEQAVVRPSGFAWHTGSVLLWITLLLGLASHVVGILVTLVVWRTMGSDDMALMAELATIPFGPVALLLFIMGALLIKGVKRHSWYAGVIGVLLSTCSFAFWFLIATQGAMLFR